MDTRIEEISKIIDELSTTQALWLKGLKDKIKYHLDDDFDGEGDNIMDRLPTIDEALKLKEENEKLKKEIEKLTPQGEIKEVIQKLKEEIWRWKVLPEEFGLDSRVDICNMIYKLKEEREHFNQEFHKTLQHQVDDKEQYEKEIEDLKKQIPDKKGKKLSQNDKVVLKRIRDSIQLGPDDVCSIAETKLLKRLLK